jgi:hypothetical protein
MIVFHNRLLRPFTVGIDKPLTKTVFGCLSNVFFWLLSPSYHRFSLLLYLVLVSGAVADK